MNHLDSFSLFSPLGYNHHKLEFHQQCWYAVWGCHEHLKKQQESVTDPFFTPVILLGGFKDEF